MFIIIFNKQAPKVYEISYQRSFFFKSVVDDWVKWKAAHERVLESGRALAASSGQTAANRITEELTRLKQLARQVFEACELKEKQERFDSGVGDMRRWLSDTEQVIQRSCPLSYDAVRSRLQDLEVGSDHVLYARLGCQTSF